MATHVMNASGYIIWVQVDSDRIILSEKHEKVRAKMGFALEKLFSAEAEVEYAYNMKQQAIHVAQSEGFTRIGLMNYLKFTPTRGTGTVYVSIFYQERKDGAFVPIASAFPIPYDSSVIVNKHCEVKTERMHTLWTDTDGHDHSKGNYHGKNHLANGSDHQIWAILDVDRIYTSRIAQKIAALHGQKQFLTAEMHGFKCIQPNQVHCFEPYGYCGSGDVYYSIFKEQDGGLQLITGTMERPRDTSIIVSRWDKVHLERHGTLWIDTDGVNHRR